MSSLVVFSTDNVVVLQSLKGHHNGTECFGAVVMKIRALGHLNVGSNLKESNGIPFYCHCICRMKLWMLTTSCAWNNNMNSRTARMNNRLDYIRTRGMYTKQEAHNKKAHIREQFTECLKIV